MKTYAYAEESVSESEESNTNEPQPPPPGETKKESEVMGCMYGWCTHVYVWSPYVRVCACTRMCGRHCVCLCRCTCCTPVLAPLPQEWMLALPLEQPHTVRVSGMDAVTRPLSHHSLVLLW